MLATIFSKTAGLRTPTTVCACLAASTKSRPSLPLDTRPRRLSSSKPVSPPNNNSDSLLPSAPSQSRQPKRKANSKSSKSKAAESSSEQHTQLSSSQRFASSLPSVPSTQHVKAEAIHLASLFAIHRPISLSDPLPPTISDDSFSTIFEHREPVAPADVISTLSKTANSLDKVIASLQRSNIRDIFDQPQATPQESESDQLLNAIEKMALDFKHFRPPPPPQPLPGLGNGTNSAFFTIMQDVQEIPGSMPEAWFKQKLLMKPTFRQPFLHRMAIRQYKWRQNMLERAQTRIIYRALSVKRQRKLKMKKHKYKKLMKRTRSLRKREGRL